MRRDRRVGNGQNSTRANNEIAFFIDWQLRDCFAPRGGFAVEPRQITQTTARIHARESMYLVELLGIRPPVCALPPFRIFAQQTDSARKLRPQRLRRRNRRRQTVRSGNYNPSSAFATHTPRIVGDQMNLCICN
jgi:hypothetical protein